MDIGKAGRAAFELPLAVTSEACAVVGVRGKGKTSTAVVIVEEALDAGVQVVAIDPTDVWFGLRSSGDGKRSAYPVLLLGGPHGDLPLTDTSGPAVADFVVANRVPVILSLRHLRKGAAQRFVAEFVEQLYHRKGEPEHRRPLLLVIDEASRFCPQRIMAEKGSYLSRCVGAIEDAVRQGRSAGLGVLMVDQRPATLNKDVLTQIEMLVAHAVTSPQDRDALMEWVRGRDSAGHRVEFERDLASLDKGEAWFWRPASDLFARVRVRAKHTFDSSKTPELGEDAAAPRVFATVDLGALQKQLEDAVQAAIDNDPKLLKKRIVELERQLSRAEEIAAETGVGPSEQDIESAVRAAVEEERGRAQRELLGLLDRVRDAVNSVSNGMVAARQGVEGIYDEVNKIAGAEPAPVEFGTPVFAKAPRIYQTVPLGGSRVAQERHARAATKGRITILANGDLGGPHRKILGALAWLETIGVMQPSVEALAFVAGYRSGGGAFNNPKGALRTKGLIDYPAAGTVALTEAGRAVAEPPDTPRTRKALHEMVMAKLSGPERKILEPLLHMYPEPMRVSELAIEAGYRDGGGAFNNPRGRLRTLGLIDYPRPGMAVACEILFPRGLR